MPSSAAGPSEELAARQAGRAVPGVVLPDGPRYPRIVQAWLWLKRPTWFLDRCSRAYGDVFTMRLPLGLNLVHIADPQLVKAVFADSDDVLRAGRANAAVLEPLLGPHSVLVLDGPEHMRQRKLILPAFHGDRMRAWEATIRDVTRAEIARWPAGTPFALRPRMQSITLDVIMRVVFGIDESARQDELRRLILTVTGMGRSPFLLLATRDRRLGPHAPWARFIRARDALQAALAEQVAQRRHAPDLEQRSDVLSELLLARDDEGRAMTDDEVRDELVTLLFAGHETTATSLTWAFDLLLHHPQVLSRLMAELEGGESRYLDATITETLRVRPVVALVDRHVREATRIDGHTIPAGAVVCPNIYLTQRREDLYQDPAAFRPERFAGQAPLGFAWFPFGGGIRRCLGATFATFEMRIVIPEVLHTVALRSASQHPARIRRESVTFVPHDGGRCIVTAWIEPAAGRSLRPDLSPLRPDLRMTGYVIRGGQPGYDRLLLLARDRWPDTRALLERAGISAGMRCVDIGCGGGAVTLEIARLVAPGGRVVGIDSDEVKLGLARRAAAGRGIGNVEFRVGDAGDWAEPGGYDLVYSRFLLQHLAEPVRVLRRMWAAVASGGVLIVEDADFDGWCCDPPSEGFQVFLDTYRRVLAGRGGDHAIGRKLHRYFLSAGIAVPQVSLVQPVHEGEAKMLAWSTLDATADAILADGLATRDELTAALDSLRAFTDDPRTLICGPRVFQLWARR